MKNFLLIVIGFFLWSYIVFANSPSLASEVQRAHDRIQNLRQMWHDSQMENEKRLDALEAKRPQQLTYSLSNHRFLIRRSKTEQDKELSAMVDNAVDVYLSETGRNPDCRIGGVETTLATIVQRKIIQEGWYEYWSFGRKTNNPWSLRKSFMRDPTRLAKNDNTNRRSVYETMEDGIVELAYVVDQNYWCTVTPMSIFSYVFWPNAERTAERMKSVNHKFNVFYKLD